MIILDCVMTFFGSAANDAAFNAWLTDVSDDSNRGHIEGINAMMPLVSILVVFGGFMGLINTYFGIGGKYMPLLAMGISGFLSVLSVSKEDSWN